MVICTSPYPLKGTQIPLPIGVCLYWPGNHKWAHTGKNKQLEFLTWFFLVLLICGSLIKLNDSDAFLCAGWRGEAARPDLQAHQNSHCPRGNSSESICAWSGFWKNCFAVSPVAIFWFTSSQSRWGITGELRPLERGVSTPDLMFNNEFMPEYLFQNFQAREAKWAPWMALCASETCSNSAFDHIHLKEQELFWLQKEFSIGTAGGKSWSLALPAVVASTHPRLPAGTEGIYLHTNFTFWPQGSIDNKKTKSPSASKVEAFGNQGKIWKLLTKGNISIEKLLSASKLEVEKYQSTGGFYATVAKTLKENIVKGSVFSLFFGGTVSSGVAYILRPECSQINCFASSSLPPSLFFLSL